MPDMELLLRRAAIVCFVGLVALAACAPSEGPDNDVPTAQLSEFVRIGSYDSPGAAFSLVAAIATTPDRVLVLDARSPRVGVFDRNGSWVGDIGRPGDGPGELRTPTHVGFYDASVWVGDPSGGRVEAYSMNGDHLQSWRWRLPADSLAAPLVPIALLQDGSPIAGPASLSIGAVLRGALTHRTYHRASGAGELLDLLYTEQISTEDFVTAELPSGGFIIGAHPLPRSPLVEPFPDGTGLMVVERDGTGHQQAGYRVIAILPDGTARIDMVVPYDPIPAAGWRERHLLQMQAETRERGGTVPRGELDAMMEALSDRDHFPPVTDIVAGVDGSMWVRREETVDDAVAWDVFDRSGTLVAHLSTPKDVRLHSASLDEVWGVVTDSLDVPYVVGWEVTRRRRTP